MQATAAGGVGAIHNMVCELGLAEAIDRAIPFFKRCQPYHESDHVLALAYSFLADGRNLEPNLFIPHALRGTPLVTTECHQSVAQLPLSPLGGSFIGGCRTLSGG